eukprot:8340616-Pyramimonas_sp.AAC.1
MFRASPIPGCRRCSSGRRIGISAFTSRSPNHTSPARAKICRGRRQQSQRMHGSRARAKSSMLD